MKLRQRPLADHEEVIVRLHDEMKLTFGQIGRQLEVTNVRAHQIYTAAKLRLNDFADRGHDSLLLLPTRVRRVLEHCSLDSRATTKAAIESGRMTWHESLGAIFWDGCMLSNVSHKTWELLYAWAGRPALPSEPKF